MKMMNKEELYDRYYQPLIEKMDNTIKLVKELKKGDKDENN